MPRATVLPGGIAAGSVHPAKHSVWQQLEVLVLPLLVLHLLAFGYWIYQVTIAQRRSSSSYGGGYSGGYSGSYGGAGSGKRPVVNDTVPRALEAWRTPREILQAYTKTRLGKD